VVHVWERGDGQTDTQTHTQTDSRDHYTFRLGYASHEMYSTKQN